MRPILLFGGFLLWLGEICCAGTASYVPSNVTCYRFHAQWKVSEVERRELQAKYGIVCISFDSQGRVQTHNLPRSLQARFLNLYNQCMRDGCVFCDASEGSCEQGNCGVNNSCCKPYMEKGRPVCGEECGYYALRQL